MHDENTTEIAWAAGVFEGEGSIAFTTKTGVQLVMGMCDADVVERFADVVGCGSIYVETRGKKYWRDFHRWVVSDKDDAERLLVAFLPWFGKRRTARACAALERLALNPGRNGEKTHCIHGHEYTPENTYWWGANKPHRQCRACAKIRGDARNLARREESAGRKAA